MLPTKGSEARTLVENRKILPQSGRKVAAGLEDEATSEGLNTQYNHRRFGASH